MGREKPKQYLYDKDVSSHNKKISTRGCFQTAQLNKKNPMVIIKHLRS